MNKCIAIAPLKAAKKYDTKNARFPKFKIINLPSIPINNISLTKIERYFTKIKKFYM
jgi:hypothetical protein